MSAFVYTFLADDDAVLYVGCTEHIGRRIIQHQLKQWWPDVARIKCDVYPDLKTGRDIEALTIRNTQPIHNTVMTDKHEFAGGWATRKAHDAGEPCPNPLCGVHRTKTVAL